jgi:lipopolysaccharide/colanic/teichoic acid biosynthesis glycosyltransferase
METFHFSKRQIIYFFFKRIIDILGSIVGIIVLSPIFILCLIVTSTTSKGGPFFTQKRYGKNMKIFNIIKFRSMKVGMKQIGAEGLSVTEQADMTTRWGRFMRRTSLDEIPQLLNILTGSMSFIGPRPNMIENSDELIKARLSFVPNAYFVKPGLSGYAQIHMKRSHGIEEKSREDSYYVQNVSFWLDAQIFVYSLFLELGFAKGR